MLLTKFSHSCVRLEQDGSVLVIDPGSFSEVEEALEGASAVLVTHEHPDHIAVDRVVAVLAADLSVQLWAPRGVADAVAEGLGDAAGDRIHAVGGGEEFSAAGVDVRTFGGQHALIHPLIPLVANVGFLVGGTVYHPGDSFIVPEGVEVRTLLVPVHAPWSKLAEVVDFVTSVRAPRAFQIHDALLNETGLGMVEGHVTRLGARYGTTFRHLDVRSSVEL
ncbi:MBL fold metallo-hydrolase [Arthrobacter agilis]|jgi:L-ascorbate metabolism protein UlaG (beta-lactamase superfamily)|uniref:MBL fold metallo-hydrolase n=1 Tax=Arthrobacter agilis TaxID=37921 RepID=UPI002787143A|nr:MBL fold metallo-hydrolase [Arthrobacter agilis]MDQ0735461.1 L-ascorbate metabolism protein UlaG (beta-lactamase superfamily) [Arthrobacter agilis]